MLVFIKNRMDKLNPFYFLFNAIKFDFICFLVYFITYHDKYALNRKYSLLNAK